jgi:hypothetical protein
MTGLPEYAHTPIIEDMARNVIDQAAIAQPGYLAVRDQAVESTTIVMERELSHLFPPAEELLPITDTGNHLIQVDGCIRLAARGVGHMALSGAETLQGTPEQYRKRFLMIGRQPATPERFARDMWAPDYTRRFMALYTWNLHEDPQTPPNVQGYILARAMETGDIMEAVRRETGR